MAISAVRSRPATRWRTTSAISARRRMERCCCRCRSPSLIGVPRGHAGGASGGAARRPCAHPRGFGRVPASGRAALQLLFARRLAWLPSSGQLAGRDRAAPPVTGMVLLDALPAGHGRRVRRARWPRRAPAPCSHCPPSRRSSGSTRAETIQALRADYIAAARAYGLGPGGIAGRAQDAMLPSLAMIGLRFGWMLGSTAPVETVFDGRASASMRVTSAIASDFKPVMGVHAGDRHHCSWRRICWSISPMAGSIRGWRRHEPGLRSPARRWDRTSGPTRRARYPGADDRAARAAAARGRHAGRVPDSPSPPSSRAGCSTATSSTPIFEPAMPNPARAAAVRPRPRPRHRLLRRLRRTHAGRPRFNTAILVAARRRHARPLPQGPPARLGRTPARRALPAAREALLRVWRPRLPRLPRAGPLGGARSSA